MVGFGEWNEKGNPKFKTNKRIELHVSKAQKKNYYLLHNILRYITKVISFFVYQKNMAIILSVKWTEVSVKLIYCRANV